MDIEDKEQYIAFLEARVAALEEALRRRSRTLCAIQSEVCPTDLQSIARIEAGPTAEPSRLPETTELMPADVEATMHELWRAEPAEVAQEARFRDEGGEDS